MSDIKINTPDFFELRNPAQLADRQNEPPTLVCEAGVWNSEAGNKSGISIATYGELSPLIEPQDARRLAKWLNAAADELSGEKPNHADRKKRKRWREYDDNDDNY